MTFTVGGLPSHPKTSIWWFPKCAQECRSEVFRDIGGRRVRGPPESTRKLLFPSSRKDVVTFHELTPHKLDEN